LSVPVYSLPLFPGPLCFWASARPLCCSVPLVGRAGRSREFGKGGLAVTFSFELFFRMVRLVTARKVSVGGPRPCGFGLVGVTLVGFFPGGDRVSAFFLGSSFMTGAVYFCWFWFVGGVWGGLG